jgi:hypothetical protein
LCPNKTTGRKATAMNNHFRLFSSVFFVGLLLFVNRPLDCFG